MSTVLPYTPKDLTRLIAEAKACIERSEPDLLAAMCHDLLPWASRADVDRTLGMLLKLLLRHASATSIAKIEAEAFSLDRLSHGWNPQDASVAYLSWKYRQAFQPERDPDVAQVQALAVAAQALWPHLNEPTRLLQGLYVKLSTAHAALGNVRSLRELGEDLLSGPLNDERQQTGLLRIIKQLQRLRGAPEIECVLEQLLARPEHNPAWVEAVLTAIAALCSVAQRLSDYQRLARLLGLVLQWFKHARNGLCDTRLVTALIRCAEFARLHELLPHLLDNMGEAAARSVLLSTLEQLFRYEMLGDAGQYIERVYRQDPGDPRAALVLGQFLLQQGVSHTEIMPLFEAIRPDAPQHDKAIIWVARRYYGMAEYDQFIRWLDTHPLHEPDKARLLLNRLREAMECPSLPHCVSGADGERLSLEAMGQLTPLLTPLVHATNGDFSYAAQPSRDELRIRLRGVEQAVAQVTEREGNLTPSTCLNIVRELVRTATLHMRGTLAERHATPIAFGPQYGLLDATRMNDIFETLHRVALRLSQHGIESALHDAPLADVRDLCHLAELHIQSAFALGQARTSEVLLQTLHARRVAPALMLRLLERCALQQGDLRTAEQRLVGQATETGQILAIEPFEMWSRTEALACDVLVDEEPWKGTFEYRDTHKVLHLAAHEVPPTRVALLRVPALRVCDGDLLISPRGAIPHPHPWHLHQVYGYPRRSSIYINHGEGGCRLRRTTEKLHLREPVVVLFNVDALYRRNYYHWMLLILTRIAVLLDRGLFEHRRLLLPIELSEWMKISLELVGLPEERIAYFTAAQEVLVDDALLVTSVEFAAAALIKPLKRRLWAAAGVDPAAGRSGPPVWLSRRRQHLRHLANTDAVETLAHQLGFQVVAPESLSLRDQVRLCAEARAIAGPGGANLTNLMFASPGTPVLGLVNENDNYPTFVDLCAVMNLPQRWLFGHADPRKAWWGFHNEPYEIELTMLEYELQRLVADR